MIKLGNLITYFIYWTTISNVKYCKSDYKLNYIDFKTDVEY